MHAMYRRMSEHCVRCPPTLHHQWRNNVPARERFCECEMDVDVTKCQSALQDGMTDISKRTVEHFIPSEAHILK